MQSLAYKLYYKNHGKYIKKMPLFVLIIIIIFTSGVRKSALIALFSVIPCYLLLYRSFQNIFSTKWRALEAYLKRNFFVEIIVHYANYNRKNFNTILASKNIDIKRIFMIVIKCNTETNRLTTCVLPFNKYCEK